MTPRPWVNRECSAVGNTQRALWSWLIRRSRWTQAVSRRSSSAASSSGRPAARGLGRRQPLGQLDVAVDRVADQVDRAERVARHQARVAVVARRAAARHASRPRRRGATPARGPPRRRPTTGSRAGSRSCRRRSPATSASRRRSPATRSDGCQRASRTRLATAGEKRRTTSTGSWSAMMSQARSNIPATIAGSGGGNDSGVSETSRIRSILKVRIASRVSSQPIEVQRVGLERRLDQVRPDARGPRRRLRRVAAPARSRATTTRRSAQAWVSRWTWRLNALVGRAPRQDVEASGRRARARAGGRIAAELLERGREVRVVLVGVADHQPGRQDDGHRLAPGQLQRRQERRPPRCPSGPPSDQSGIPSSPSIERRSR